MSREVANEGIFPVPNSKNYWIDIPIMKVKVSSHYPANFQNIHDYLLDRNIL